MDLIEKTGSDPELHVGEQAQHPLPFIWRLAVESFSYHANELRLLIEELERSGLRFALTSNNTEPFMVFVVVDCAPRERDALIARLESHDLASIASVITLPGYLAMLPHLGNDQPWVLGDPSSLLRRGAPGQTVHEDSERRE